MYAQKLTSTGTARDKKVKTNEKQTIAENQEMRKTESVKAVWSAVVCYGGKDLWNRQVLSLERQ